MLLGEKGLDSRKAGPTCRRAWPPTPSLSDKSCVVAVWARRPWRGKHFIKLKCFWDGGTETRGQHPQAPGQVPAAGTVPLCSPVDPKDSLKDAQGCQRGASLPPDRAPRSPHPPPVSTLGPGPTGQGP